MAILLIPFAVSTNLLGAAGVDDSKTPDRTADSMIAPRIKILAVTLDQQEVHCSCQVANLNEGPVRVHGFRPDSFDPPLTGSRLVPVEAIEFLRNGRWENHQIILGCGVGLGDVELAGNRVTAKAILARIPV